MWIFTEIGYFSVGCMEDDANVLMVRGRVKKDFERLIDTLNQLGIDSPEILEWEGRDYPYRVLLSRDEWGDVLVAMSKLVTYTKFKTRIKEVDGDARYSLYMRIWSVLLGAARTVGEDWQTKSLYDAPGGYPFDDGGDLANEDTTPYAVLEGVLYPSPPPPPVVSARRRKWFGKR